MLRKDTHHVRLFLCVHSNETRTYLSLCNVCTMCLRTVYCVQFKDRSWGREFAARHVCSKRSELGLGALGNPVTMNSLQDTSATGTSRKPPANYNAWVEIKGFHA